MNLSLGLGVAFEPHLFEGGMHIYIYIYINIYAYL